MTAIGVTVYLFYLDEVILLLISIILFVKLIIFHFIMEYFDRKKSQTRTNQNMERINMRSTLNF